MMQFSSFADSSLFLQDKQGPCLLATPEQMLEIARRVVELQVRDGMLFSSPAVVKSFLGTKLAGYERVVFVMLSLDTRHRFLDFVELFQGTIDGAEVHPREVVKRALKFNAAAVVVVHTIRERRTICGRPGGERTPEAGASLGRYAIAISLRRGRAKHRVTGRERLDMNVGGVSAPLFLCVLRLMGCWSSFHSGNSGRL